MKIMRYNRQEFEASLKKGSDWKDRCEKVGNAVEEILEDSPNKIHRAGDLTSAILKAYDIPGDRMSPMYRTISKNITAIGKLPENKKFISLGKEIRCGNKPDGSPRYARERLWKSDKIGGIEIDKVWIDEMYHVDGVKMGKAHLQRPDLAPAGYEKVEPKTDHGYDTFERTETNAQPEHKSPMTLRECMEAEEVSAQPEHKPPSQFTHSDTFISMWMGIRFDELKDHPEQLAVFKEWVKENTGIDMDSVQGVDNSKFSKHPSPGAARVDCGECGGSGKVYMKQQEPI